MDINVTTEAKEVRISLLRKICVMVVAATAMMGFGLSLTVESVLQGYFLKETVNMTEVGSLQVNGSANIIIENFNFTVPDEQKMGLVFRACYTTLLFLVAGITCVVMSTGLIKLRSSVQLLVSLLFFGFGFFLNGITMSAHFLIAIGRILCGIGLGISSSMVVPFVEHNIPEKQQEVYKTTAVVFISVGAFLTALLGLLFRNFADGYRYVFLMYAAFYLLVAGLLFAKGDFKEGDEPKVIKINLTKTKHFIKKYKIQLFYVGFLHLFQQLALINFVFLNANSIFEAAADPKSTGNIPIPPQYCTAILTFLGIPSGIIAIFLIKRLGNPTLSYFTSVISTAAVLFGLGMKIFPQISLFLYIFFFYLGLGQLTWSLTPSLGPKEIEPQLCLFGSFVHFCSSCMIPFILKLFLAYYKEESHYCYFFAAGVLVVGGVGMWFIFKDAKKRNELFLKDDLHLQKNHQNIEMQHRLWTGERFELAHDVSIDQVNAKVSAGSKIYNPAGVKN